MAPKPSKAKVAPPLKAKLDIGTRQSTLVRFSRGSYASHRAIERLLRQVREEGIPDASSRASQWRARAAIAGQVGPFGPLVQDLVLPHSDITYAVQHPMAMLHFCCGDEKYVGFVCLMRYALRNHPPADGPWHLVMYADEIGHNPLGHDNRKCECIYWSFLEFGPAALQTEDAWFIVCVIRTKQIEKLSGFMSHMFKLLLKRYFFNSQNGHHFKNSGVRIVIEGKSFFIFAEFGAIVADEKALKEVFCCKGASGFKFCPICYELCDHKADPAYQIGYIPGTCLDLRKLKRQYNTNESIRHLLVDLRDMHARWQRAEITKDQFEKTEKHYGWNHEPENLLLDEELDVKARDVLMHDWIHIYVVNGLFNVEVQFLLLFLKAAGILPRMIYDFCSQWIWPKHMHPPRDVFSDARVSFDNDHFKCDANEALHIYAVLAVFLTVVVVPKKICILQVQSFLKLADVLDLLSMVKHGLVDAEAVKLGGLAHLRAYQAAYSVVSWIPKHHLSIHLSDADKRLIGCLPHERRHKLVKRWSKDRYTLQSFEKGVMEELTLEHLYALETDWLSPGLVEPRAPEPNILTAFQDAIGDPLADDIKCSMTARVCHGSLVSAGDLAWAMIENHRCLVDVVYHFESGGEPYTYVNMWESVPGPSDNAQAATFREISRETDHLKCVRTECIVASAIFLPGARPNVATALVPPFLR